MIVPFANLLALAREAKIMPPLTQCTALMIGLKGLVARLWVINPLFVDRLAKSTINYTQTKYYLLSIL